MTREQTARILEQQFAADYNCSPADFHTPEPLLTVLAPGKDARRFEHDSVLNLLTFQNKPMLSAREELLPWCRETLLPRLSAPWCMEAGCIVRIDKKLAEIGFRVDQAHLFFVPDRLWEGREIPTRVLNPEDIRPLEQDERIDEAFLFADYVRDVLGIAALDEAGEMTAVAGATDNSPRMWEIGVNSFREGHAFARTAVAELARQIEARGVLPYYGTAISHLASQRVALGAGFVPTFAELRSVPL